MESKVVLPVTDNIANILGQSIMCHKGWWHFLCFVHTVN